MDANGTNIRVPMQPRVVISISRNGPEKMDANGTNIRVPMQPRVVILMSCNGPERIDAHGTKIRLTVQPRVVISIFSNGQDRTDAHEIIVYIVYRAARQRNGDIWIYECQRKLEVRAQYLNRHKQSTTSTRSTGQAPYNEK